MTEYRVVYTAENIEPQATLVEGTSKEAVIEAFECCGLAVIEIEEA